MLLQGEDILDLHKVHLKCRIVQCAHPSSALSTAHVRFRSFSIPHIRGCTLVCDRILISISSLTLISDSDGELMDVCATAKNMEAVIQPVQCLCYSDCPLVASSKYDASSFVMRSMLPIIASHSAMCSSGVILLHAKLCRWQLLNN